MQMCRCRCVDVDVDVDVGADVDINVEVDIGMTVSLICLMKYSPFFLAFHSVDIWMCMCTL